MFIDVIIPVFNALSQTSRCVESVLRNSSGDFRVVLVNDRSDEQTSEFLRTFIDHPRVTLIENEENLGFLKTVNKAMAFSMSADVALDGRASGRVEAVILLNSDTIVPAGWLERFRECFASDKRIGLATAVSNNAENLSIPIPPGYHIHNFAPIVQEAGSKIGFPDITTAIGFCLGIRREVLDQIGLFDEIFGRGYAEDSDFHYRAVTAGFRSVLVANCFVYHEHHASFSDSAMVQVRKNRPIFDQRWSTIYLNELKWHDTQRPLQRLQEAIDEILPKRKRHDILFILPTSRLFGGIIVVYELVNRLVDSGLDVGVVVANWSEPLQMELCFAPYFIPPTEWKENIPEAGVYVATHYETCAFAFAAADGCPGAKVSYLIQGYESWFPGALVEKVVDTYRAIPNRVVVSRWLLEMLGRWDCDAELIPNGVDTKFFYPPSERFSGERSEKPTTVLTMLRQDPQGGWKFTIELLRQLKQLRPNVKIIAVGELAVNSDVREWIDEPHKSADRKSMRRLYQSADIFFDSSMVQGFGLMGLEAMSCGVAVVTSATGGVREYATPENSLLVPIGSPDALLQGVIQLIDDPLLRGQIARAGYHTAVEMDWWNATASYEQYFRKLLDSSTEADVHPASVRKFFVNEFLRDGQQENWLLQAMEILGKELAASYFPSSTAQVFEKAGRLELPQQLASFPAGIALLRMYEESVHAVSRAANHRIAPVLNAQGATPGFVDHIRGILPNRAVPVKDAPEGKGV